MLLQHACHSNTNHAGAFRARAAAGRVCGASLAFNPRAAAQESRGCTKMRAAFYTFKSES